MLTITAQFIAGLFLLLVSAEQLVLGTVKIAKKYKISELFVSLVIIALGTNIPELTVAVNAIISGDAPLSIGNLIGSSIVNMTLVFGIGVVLLKLRVGNSTTGKNILLLLLSVFSFILIRQTNLPIIAQGLLLLSLGVGILCIQYLLAVGSKRQKHLFKSTAKHAHFSVLNKLVPEEWQFLLLLLSLIGISFGGRLIVSAVENIAALTQLSTTILGLTLVSLSTTLPEITTVVIAALRKDSKIIAGTAIGSSIYNLTLLTGLVTVFQTNVFIPGLLQIALLLITILFAGIILSFIGKIIPKKYGYALLFCFLCFIVFSWL